MVFNRRLEIDHSASVLQRFFRKVCYLKRRTVLFELKCNSELCPASAKCIQKAWRCYAKVKALRKRGTTCRNSLENAASIHQVAGHKHTLVTQERRALVIQRRWRSYRFKVRCDSATRIQRALLIWFEMKTGERNAAYHQERTEASIRLIQSSWRSHIKHNAANFITRWWQKCNHDLRQRRASAIQRKWREYRRASLVNTSAQIIQMTWRRHVYTTSIASLSQSMEKYAAVIQFSWRKHHKSRRAAESIASAETILQSDDESSEEIPHIGDMDESRWPSSSGSEHKTSTKIQAISRGFIVRALLQRNRDAAVSIQQAWRIMQAKRRIRRQMSIVRIQNWIRAILVPSRTLPLAATTWWSQSVEKKRRQETLSTLVVQRLWRGHIARKCILSKVSFVAHRRIVLFQSYARSKLSALSFSRQKLAAKAIQRWWRHRRLGIPLIIRRYVAAIVIGRWYVSLKTAHILSILKCAVSLLQRVVNGNFSRPLALYALLQMRASLRFKSFISREAAATHRCNTLVESSKDAVATLIQCFFRGYQTRKILPTKQTVFSPIPRTNSSAESSSFRLCSNAGPGRCGPLKGADIYQQRLAARALQVLQEEAEIVAEHRVRSILCQRKHSTGYYSYAHFSR
jgi:IQ calmodulin-binding motif